jgi:hypothetical protein
MFGRNFSKGYFLHDPYTLSFLQGPSLFRDGGAKRRQDPEKGKRSEVG